MEIWLDTTDKKSIEEALNLGILHGVTTNPSLVAKSGRSLDDLLEELLDIQEGQVAVQVVGKTAEEIIREAEFLTAHSPRVIVKVPVTKSGLQTIHTLTQKNIPIMATAIFDPFQALLAFKAGAHYLAPYIGRMSDLHLDPYGSIRIMQKMRERYQFEGKIIAAGIRHLDSLIFCLEEGISAITLNTEKFRELTEEHTATAEAFQSFQKDWEQAKPSKLLSS